MSLPREIMTVCEYATFWSEVPDKLSIRQLGVSIDRISSFILEVKKGSPHMKDIRITCSMISPAEQSAFRAAEIQSSRSPSENIPLDFKEQLIKGKALSQKSQS